MLAKTLMLAASAVGWVAAAASPPNIIFILTDDQDVHLNSLSYMGGVQNNLINQGVSYMHHFCTVALCCPSRVNLWTGKAAHNTNVTSLMPPYGGYQKFISQGLNDKWLFPWMQQAGYQTYYVGKLMNSYGASDYNDPFPAGFNGSDFLFGEGTYNYYNSTYQRNHNGPVSYPGNYTTDVLWQKSLGFLQDAAKSKQPFFLTMAPVAPHTGTGRRPPGNYDDGPVPSDKYANYFNDAIVPRTANFNPDKPSGTSWLLDLNQLNQSTINDNDNYFRNRLRALQSVDDVVNSTFAYLQQNNLMDNTYVLYSTDNGFHISQHRLYPGKNCPYEEDVNVPFIIRGPGITAGSSVNVATTHTDVAATILYLAGATLPADLDGSPMPVIDANPETENFEHASIEHWGTAGMDEGHQYPEAPGSKNTTYKALRIIGNGYNYYYSVWCSNQHELYDMSGDSQQLNNLYANYTYKPNEPYNSTNPFSINRLESRLDALLLVLKECKASTCQKPWLALHPGGAVSNLRDALQPKYDQFYEQQQNRVSYNYCDQGYIKAAEGPLTFKTYSAS